MLIADVRIASNYEKTCACNLLSCVQIPSNLIRNGVVYASVDSSTAKQSVYVACAISSGNWTASSLCVPNCLLKKLQIMCNDLVTLTILDPSAVPLLSSVSLDAASPFELDVLRSNESDLEQTFLRQCSFVHLGMRMPVWCGSQLVYCTVTNFHPVSIESRCGRLGVSTTLHLDCRQQQLQHQGSRAVALRNATPPTAGVAGAEATEAAVGPPAVPAAGPPAWMPGVLLALADFVCRWLLGYGMGLGEFIRLRAACAGWAKRINHRGGGGNGGGGFEPPLLLQVRPTPDAARAISEPNCGLVNPRHLLHQSHAPDSRRRALWSIVQLLPLGPRDPAVVHSPSGAQSPPPLLLLMKLLPCDATPPDCLRLDPACAAAAGLGCGVWVRVVRPEGRRALLLNWGECARPRELRIDGARRPDATKQALDGFLRDRTADDPVLIAHNCALAFTDSSGEHHVCASVQLLPPPPPAASDKGSNHGQEAPRFALLCRETAPRIRVAVAVADPAMTTATATEVEAEDGEADGAGPPLWLAAALEPTLADLEGRFDSVVRGARLSHLALLRGAESGAGGGQTGKTSLLRLLACRLRARGYCAVGVEGGGRLDLDCRRLARLELPSARRRLWSAARVAAARAPACVCLDNLEAACAPVEDAMVGTGAEVHQLRLCHAVRSLLKWLRHQPAVMLVATSGGQLNSQLIDSATGQCLFDTDDPLEVCLTPTDDMRGLLSDSGVGRGSGSGGGVDRLSPGEYARCLRVLAYCRRKRDASDHDCGRLELGAGIALVPASLRQCGDECDPMLAKLPLEYHMIRGLDSAKEVLERAIVWPLRYPQLVRRSRGGGGGGPSASASGVLLTGPPGCGKSLLARALARRIRVRLLAVRGPELLNKFVGASERAVRDLFAKARRLRPCLVFLDEVDALAPRRGNDTTGVTDRVVNQLLTELDGLDADGLDGVALVAATNRPDLLDPALLRPGRIGLRAVCPAPDRSARGQILASLLPAAGLPVAEAELARIAEATEGYCSADFNALMLHAAAAAAADGDWRGFGWAELASAIGSVRPSLIGGGGGGQSDQEPIVVRAGQRVMFA